MFYGTFKGSNLIRHEEESLNLRLEEEHVRSFVEPGPVSLRGKLITKILLCNQL